MSEKSKHKLGFTPVLTHISRPLPEQGAPANLLQEHLRQIAKEYVDAGASHLYIVDIDQELATRLLLQTPPSQRLLNSTTSGNYAKDMRAGKWRADLCEPLQFDANMQLVNGQHRLDGVRKSQGFVLKDAFLVVLKTAAETMALPVDLTRKRTRADYQRTYGVFAPPQMSAGLVRESNSWRNVGDSGNALDQAKIVAEHPCLEHLATLKHSKHATAGVMAGIARVFRYATDKSEVREFFTHVLENNQHFRGEHSPNIQYTANWLTARTKVDRDTFFYECAWRMIKAWNDYKIGRIPKMLPRYVHGELTPDIYVHP